MDPAFPLRYIDVDMRIRLEPMSNRIRKFFHWFRVNRWTVDLERVRPWQHADPEVGSPRGDTSAERDVEGSPAVRVWDQRQFLPPLVAVRLPSFV
jgi:hypothetical protein